MAKRRADVPDIWRLTTRRREPNVARNAPPWVLVAIPVVLLAAVLGLAYLVQGIDPPHSTARPVASAPSRADDVVRAYLHALATSDAAAAITASSPAPSGPFVTNAVLAAQQRMAPLRDIVVSENGGSGSRDDVDVQYSFGTRHVRTRIAVVKSHGRWRVQDGTVAIDVRYARDIPGLSVWGRPVTQDVIYVFPGPVPFGSTDPNLAVVDKDADDFAVEPTVGWGAPNLDVELRAAGRARAVAATVNLLRSCQASVRLEPSGCPQRAYDYEALGSPATWRLVGDPARGLDVTFDGPTYRRVRVSGDVKWTVDYAARRFGGAVDRKQAEVTSFVDGTFDLAAASFALD